MTDDTVSAYIPIDASALEAPLQKLVARARQLGADTADAVATHGRSLSITVRDGELEDVDNSEGRDIGLRVLVGRRQACVSSSDLSDAAMEQLVMRAVAMAKLAPEDPHAGLLEPSYLSKDVRDLDLFDPTVLTPEDLQNKAIAIEEAALSVKGVAQAEGCSASASSSAVYYVTSHGFSHGWRSSRFDLAGMAIATDGSAMERDVDYHGMRWWEDVYTPKYIGRQAGERAVARLGARKMKSGQMPVLFDARVASSFLSAFTSAISGPSIARGTSFLKTNMGETVFAPSITIIDDPFIARGHGSRPWDGEGMLMAPTPLIDKGVLTTWLLNASTARQLDLEPSGHAQRGLSSPPGVGTSNLALMPGQNSPQDLMSQMGDGLWVCEMFGPSLNANTGDWSVGVAGFKIENGEVAYPVSEITVAGNLLDIFKTMIPANDFERRSAVTSPSILVERLTIAGN